MGKWNLTSSSSEIPAPDKEKISTLLSGTRTLNPNQTARLSTTPTTAAVTPVSAAWPGIEPELELFNRFLVSRPADRARISTAVFAPGGVLVLDTFPQCAFVLRPCHERKLIAEISSESTERDTGRVLIDSSSGSIAGQER